MLVGQLVRNTWCLDTTSQHVGGHGCRKAPRSQLHSYITTLLDSYEMPKQEDAAPADCMHQKRVQRRQELSRKSHVIYTL